MSHQRFRFLLQSGVWHLPFFTYSAHLCLCAACVDTTNRMRRVQPCHFHQRKHPLVVAPVRPPASPPLPFHPRFLLHRLPVLSLLLFLLLLLTSLTPGCLPCLCAAHQPGSRRPFPGGVPAQRQSHESHQRQYGRRSRSPQPGESRRRPHRAHPLRHQSRKPALLT